MNSAKRSEEESLEALADALKHRFQVEVNVEYPGFLTLRLGNGKFLVIGATAETWTVDVYMSDQEFLWGINPSDRFDTEVAYCESDIDRIADAVVHLTVVKNLQ